MPGGFLGVLLCLHVMAVSQVSVTPSLLVVPGFVVVGGMQMMLRGVLVMLRCFAMMVDGFFRHGILSFR